MTSLQPCNRWLELEQVGPITVVRFTRRSILEEEGIAALAEELSGALAEQERPQVVLNFRNVESLSTFMVSKLLTLHKRIEAAGGQMALCEISPFLREIFKIVRLPMYVRIFEEEQDALGDLW